MLEKGKLYGSRGQIKTPCTEQGVLGSSIQEELFAAEGHQQVKQADENIVQ